MKTRSLLAAVPLCLAALSPAQAGGGLPDLVVASATAASTHALPNQQVAVACEVANIGVGPAGLSRLKYYFSNDASYDAGDTYLNYDDVDALSASAAGGETANVRVPAGTPHGDYFILFVADHGEEVVEADETNNVFALPITVGSPAAGPDLVVADAVANTRAAEPHEVVAVTAQVRNLGSEGAAETRLKYYLSADTSYDAADTYLNYDVVAPLAPGAASPEDANLRVPASTPPGEYFFLFVADQTSAVAETDESNNVVALPVWVGVRPDLALTAVTTSTSLVRTGESVAVSAIVENLGDASAPDVTLKYMLSTDTVFDPSDKQLSYDKVDALGPGAVGAEDAVLNISTATVAGEYFILFVVDPDDLAPEHDEDDNVVAVPITITEDHPTGNLPDLVFASASLAAPQAAPGGTVAIDVVVENVGVAAAGASRVAYYFSTDTSLDAGDTYLNYDAVGSLEVGETSPEDANLTIPAGASAGTAFVLAVADSARKVAERYESNNVVALPITIGSDADASGDDPSGHKPDLVVADAWLADVELRAGERAHLFSEIANVGVAPAGASQAKYYLSRDAVLDPFDSYAGLDGVAALAVGDHSPEDVQPLIPATTAGGLWHLLIVVDAKDEVAERYESNNVTAVPFEVVVDDPSLDAADLAISDPTLSKAVVGAGLPVTLEAVLENVGTQPADPSRLKLYLSADAWLDAGDAYLDYRQIDALPIGAAVALEARLRVPAATADGDYHLLVALDVGHEVVESFESNNVVALPITVGVDAGPSEPFPYACPSSVYVDPALLPQHTVATFNALHLGWNYDKDMTALACVVAHFDLVGLVEIATPQGLADLEAALETLTGEAWSSHLSEWAVGNENGTEYYGYVWRDAEVVMNAALGFYDDPNDAIKREPYGASFSMGSFDFTLVVFHLQYGSDIAIRRAEAQELVHVYDYFEALMGPDDDLLIGGDLNLPANDSAFTVLELRGLASTTDPEQKTSIGLSGPGSSFDHIFFSPSATTERTAIGVHDFTWNNYATVRDTVSDHLPVWMAFDVDADDD